MAIVENGGGVDLGRNLENPSQDSSLPNDQDHPKQTHLRSRMDPTLNGNNGPILRPHHHDQPLYLSHGHGHPLMSNGADLPRNNDAGEDFKRDMRELQELFSKLNPLAEEFVPPSHANSGFNGRFHANNFNGDGHGSVVTNGGRNGQMNGVAGRRKKNFNQGKRRINSRTSMAQREEIIRRTVYVSDIDQQVTEEQLAGLFVSCGQVVDCRICGDPNSVLRFAFIEFTDEEGARAALNLSGTMLGFYPVRVLPSKTAIAPVNPTFLPRTEDEREMCTRTIYCTNIDRKVYRLRLLGDYHHSTRIAFVEFVMAESAIAALNCSGVVLGALPIRVSPSKTPVRPRAPRLPMH
ncbi:polyadenylate-binding protein-interacting protein 11 isoform X2 [Rhodamnia argentea]|uniref:Polyadenylate-binding protein-interacting protein 11 isoform X2 n=1 Tax=Rhodamnia argentea TaxID=178133 RepID=A0A8B8Q1L4_9MYRT|nr:polyadenylate-binding protein-interacting protein 11 isoform X2 [Rhodamnia argentea]